MKISIKKSALVMCMFLTAMGVNAQEYYKPETSLKRHDIRVSYSDGLSLGSASFWGIGLSDALTGTQRSDQKSTGVFGIGYRYALTKRFKLGMDLGVAKVTSKVTLSSDKTPSIKEKELNFLVLPTAEFVYLRRSFFELYGSALAGVDFTRHYETGLTQRGKELAQKKSKLETEFAYQVNPIGVRVGNSRIGGFVEAGLGYKGFVTAGLSLGF